MSALPYTWKYSFCFILLILLLLLHFQKRIFSFCGLAPIGSNSRLNIYLFIIFLFFFLSSFFFNIFLFFVKYYINNEN